MTNDPFSEEPSASAGSSADDPLGGEVPFAGEESVSAQGQPERSAWKAQASLGLNVARAWIRDHQTASMLGAFATGVFVGALLRD